MWTFYISVGYGVEGHTIELLILESNSHEKLTSFLYLYVYT